MKIYRCGWCGHPTDRDGEPIQQDPAGYLLAHQDATEELVQGECCPNGNESDREWVQVTREMAIDGGDRSMEGRWIQW